VYSSLSPQDKEKKVELAISLWAASAAEGWDECGQATKGMWGMSWRQEAMKGVEDCEKPGGTVKRVLIPGYPSETQGTETSKYLEEKKAKATP
jgi:hypothetical protein